MYGTTEIGVVLASYPGASDFTVKRGSLGKAVPGTRVEVHDADGHVCPPGVTGQLMVWRRGQWVPTKDLGRTDEDGYFYHGGRADDVIISAGWTMSAVEIENVMLMHPDVLEAAAIGVPDELRGQVVKAFIVLTPGSQPSAVLEEEIRAHVRGRLAPYEYPKEIEFIEQLPMTTTGKVQRRVLRELEEQRAAGTGVSGR